MAKLVPVVIAGGKGTRLWPVSREDLPKPFVSITGGERTLLQLTFDRVAKLENVSKPLVVCGSAHAELVAAQVQAIDRLVLEPEGRNTAPAVCAAALVVKALHGDEAVMLVLPADHLILQEVAFARAVAAAVELAQQGKLVTFAVHPTEPATGYGYLKMGAAINATKAQYELEAFVEKPDRVRAEGFLAAGGYAWNSGMFVFKVATLLSAFAAFEPGIVAACRQALPKDLQGDRLLLEPAAFRQAKSISIDHALMERAGNVATVVADLGWSDVGDWSAVWQAHPRDGEGVSVKGNALSLGCTNSLLQSDGPLLVGIGLSGMLAVSTRDTIVIAPMQRSQDVKLAVEKLAAMGRPEARISPVQLMAWGRITIVQQTAACRVLEVCIKPGTAADLPPDTGWRHITCVSGVGVQQGREVKAGEPLANSGSGHCRIENHGAEDLLLIVVAAGL